MPEKLLSVKCKKRQSHNDHQIGLSPDLVTLGQVTNLHCYCQTYQVQRTYRLLHKKTPYSRWSPQISKAHISDCTLTYAPLLVRSTEHVSTYIPPSLRLVSVSSPPVKVNTDEDGQQRIDTMLINAEQIKKSLDFRLHVVFKGVYEITDFFIDVFKT